MNDELKKEILSLLESPELREYLMAPPEKLNCTQYAEIICGAPVSLYRKRELLLRLNRERQTTILISSHILSELSALATHYAFIDRGRMLETISAADLRERCRDCLELRVDDAARAAQVLEEQLGTRDFEVLPQERLRLYAFLDQPQTVNRVLMEQGVGLISAQQKDSNLEDYFLSLIDGHSAGKEGV